MGYLYVEHNNQSTSYPITTALNQGQAGLRVNGGYIPVVMQTTTGMQLKVRDNGGNVLRAGNYTTTTVFSTSTSHGSSYVGCEGTSSSSGSTIDVTIEADTAMSFTSTSAYTRSSTSGYNGLSNAQAQTTSSTSSWAGSSTRRDDYQTEVANSYGLTNATALTQSITTGWDYPQAYQATRTWYHTLNRTTGYSGYSLSNVEKYIQYSFYSETAEGYADYRSHAFFGATSFNVPYYVVRSDTRYAYDQCYQWTAGAGWCSSTYYGGMYYSNIIFAENAYRVNYNSGRNDSEGCSSSGGITFTGWGTYYVPTAQYFTAVDTAGMQAETTALTEDYIDYGNPQYDYGWVVTNTVARTASSTYGYRGITSSASYYQTTLANSAGLSSVTALTRSSTSAYSGISHRRSDYYGSQVNSNNMTNATALTCSSTYGYSGITTRPEEYASSSVGIGNLSHTTVLTRESVYGYSGLSNRVDTYTVRTSYQLTDVWFQGYYNAGTTGGPVDDIWGLERGYVYHTRGYISGTKFRLGTNGYPKKDDYYYTGYNGQLWGYEERDNNNNWVGETFFPMANSNKYVEEGNIVNNGAEIWKTASHSMFGNIIRNTVYTRDVTKNYNAPYSESHLSITFTHYYTTVNVTSTTQIDYYTTTANAGVLSNETVLTCSSTSGYSGISSSQSNYAVVQNSPTGLNNVTTLTQSSTSGYSGILSRNSDYDTLIPNDGSNDLVAVALTCSSTSKWGGQSSTSVSSSTTEARTSYYTSTYNTSTVTSFTSQTIFMSESTLTTGWVAVSDVTEVIRTSTYSRTSEAISSYGARTRLSMYEATETYNNTIWSYV